MWNRVTQRLRLVYLLPLAVMIYWKKQIKSRNAVAIAVACMIPLLVAAGLGVLVFRGASATQEEPSVAVEPTVTPTPTPVPPTPTPDPVSITLSFAGDCTLGMDRSFAYAGTLNAMYDSQGADYFFQNVLDIFSADDLTVVNLEGVLSTGGERANKSWAFRGEPEYVDILTAGSVEAVNLANNHSHDYGEESFEDTKDALDSAQIEHFGFEETLVTEVSGVKVGFLGMYTVYEDESYQSELEAHIHDLQEQGAQVIVASFHWGFENDSTPEADQMELAHAAIDAGAHLVIGHHPHILQGIEQYKGRYIVYSLGNFCFGGNARPPDLDCMIFQQTFTVGADGPAVDDNVNIIPCSVSSQRGRNNYQPTPAKDAEAERILRKIESLSTWISP